MKPCEIIDQINNLSQEINLHIDQILLDKESPEVLNINLLSQKLIRTYHISKKLRNQLYISRIVNPIEEAELEYFYFNPEKTHNLLDRGYLEEYKHLNPERILLSDIESSIEKEFVELAPVDDFDFKQNDLVVIDQIIESEQKINIPDKPSSDEPSADVIIAKTTETEVVAKPLKILVCDKHEILVKLIKNLLENEGYDVVIANNGISASEILNSTKIDILITEIQIPFLSGLELLSVAKRINGSTIVIFLSQMNSQNYILQTFRMGVDDYITKPFDPKILPVKIKKALQYK